MNQQYFKGSQWRKWDLHVHTPASFEHGFSSWDEYINALEKINDFAVIGITDYFTLDGYKEVIKYRVDGRLQNFTLVVANIELRLNIFVPKRSSGEQQRRLNLHVIFSDEVSVEDIETQFLQNLEIFVEGSPGGMGDKRMITRASIEEVGRTIKKFQTSVAGLSDFAAGCKNITVTLDNLTEALQKSCFDGKYLLVLPTPDWDRISWKGQDYLTRKILLQTAHAVFCGQESTINWCLGRGDLRPAEFEREFGCLKPSLHGSDAHTIEHLCRPENGKFCWIKADPTFEGLKQIVYEPELRVKIQAEDPTESETYAKIGSLSINFPPELAIRDESGEKTDFCLNGTYDLEFSNNLTCIIGGRGSGKSTLAHLVYNSWINQELERLTSINSPLLNLDMHPNPLKKVDECTICDVPSQTEFFFQNEIEHAAKSTESMSILITSRLKKLSSLEGGKSLDDLRGDWIMSSESVDNLIEAYDHITEIDKEILKSQETINTLKKQTEIIKSEEYKKFQAKIEELSTKIANFKSYNTDYEKVIKAIEALSTTITQLDWNADQGKAIVDSLHQMLEDHKKQLQGTFEKFSADYHAKDHPGQLNQAQQDLSEYLKARGLSPENVQELAQANTRIKGLEEQIRLSKLDKKPHEGTYDDRAQTIEACKLAYEAYRVRSLEVSSSLQEMLVGLSISEKEVNFELIVDHTRLKSSLVEFVKTNLEEDTTLRTDAIERLFFDEVDIDTYIQNKQSIRDRVNEYTKAEKHRQIVQELVNDDIFLEKFHLRMLKYYFNIDNIQIQTRLGRKLLKNTSFGERCGIVMAILLVAGTNPLVVDQPEDHLDGKFISGVLVPLLRSQKNNRQILLITRDANVVVGGDAELIHILESTDQRTEILPSSIENIDHREKYIWILDGGADAFSRREQKYNISLLKSQKQNAN
ncbi:MAG: TrlF family AAA-like ATPase [Candidatus Hodarchaeota archaeon]